MLNIATDENFKELIGKKGFTLVDFYSTTCSPCKMLARVLEEVSLEYPFVHMVKLNISEYPIIGKEYRVEAVPTLLFLEDGQLVKRCVGSLNKAEVMETIKYFYYGNENAQLQGIFEEGEAE